MSTAIRDLVRRALAGGDTTGALGVCKICGGEATMFGAVDFGKSCEPSVYPLGRYEFDIPYYRCNNCEFIFTPVFDNFTDKQWAEFIYNDDYISVDPDYKYKRPAHNAFTIGAYLSAIGRACTGLDFGGGNGSAAYALRRRGWVYDSIDPFGGADFISSIRKYDFCTALEVFEHVTDPIKALSDLLSRCSPNRLLILIGTNISDGLRSSHELRDWWYAAPRNGHISLYSRKSLQILSQKMGLTYFSLGKNLHFLSRNYRKSDVARISISGKLRRTLNWPGLKAVEAQLLAEI